MKESRKGIRQDEPQIGRIKEDTLVNSLMERVVERENLIQALQQVQRNKGAPGIDGMTVEDLETHLKGHWPRVKAQLLEGDYQPQAVKRVEIAKPGGGQRNLGIPTVMDRFIQQALQQVLQSEWDSTFSMQSYGFRPNRSAHQAVLQTCAYLQEGYSWVVDMDLEKFFDRVNHDLLMHKIKQRVPEKPILVLINRFLKSGVSVDGTIQSSQMGTPQGGPLSPLLANLLLDDWDKELEKRGHRFVRYADDCNIYVKSRRSGERVLGSVSRYLETKLKLQVNVDKSAVDHPWNRSFLGFTVTRRKPHRIKVSEKAQRALKQKVRIISKRTRGHSLNKIIAELRIYLRGWRAYFQLAESQSVLRDIDKWIRRRLRCYLLKQWGRSGYRELRKRGVDRQLAWNTSKSAHGPWRLSQSPALYRALPNAYFARQGLPSVYQ